MHFKKRSGQQFKLDSDSKPTELHRQHKPAQSGTVEVFQVMWIFFGMDGSKTLPSVLLVLLLLLTSCGSPFSIGSPSSSSDAAPRMDTALPAPLLSGVVVAGDWWLWIHPNHMTKLPAKSNVRSNESMRELDLDSDLAFAVLFRLAFALGFAFAFAFAFGLALGLPLGLPITLFMTIDDGGRVPSRQSDCQFGEGSHIATTAQYSATIHRMSCFCCFVFGRLFVDLMEVDCQCQCSCQSQIQC